MKGIIQNKNFVEMEPMKYWTVPASQINKQKDIVYNAIFSGDYIGALKVDGYYQRIVKDEDGTCFMIARSRNVHGEVVDKIEWLPQIQPWLNSLPNGTCLLCECYWPGNEGSKNITSILGCLKDKAIARQKDAPLHLYIFDQIAFAGENRMNWPYERRAKAVREMAEIYKSDYIDYATYYTGAELWNQLQQYLADNREGMVIMQKSAIVYEKRTPARVSIKVKKELQQTIDCVVIGANAPSRLYSGDHIEDWQYWENTKTGEKIEGFLYNDYKEGKPIEPISKNWFYGWCGSLKIGLYKNGTLIHYGDLSGLTEDIKANWQDYVGKVVEVGGMQLDNESGVIRHPKIINWRIDKAPTDCTYDQLTI